MRRAPIVPPPRVRPSALVVLAAHAGLAGLGAPALLAMAPATVMGQEVRAAVAPDTATVGDVVQVAVRIDLPPGYRVAAADSLVLGDSLENAGPRRVLQTEQPDSSVQVTYVYPVTPWRTGTLVLPAVPVRVTGPGGVDRTMHAVVPSLTVESVLPADTAGIKPKPAHDVLGAIRLLWPYILAALLALLLLALLAYWLWRRYRRRAAAAPVVPLRTARERALEALDKVHEARLLDAGAFKEHFSRVATALRAYLAALDPRWGMERTTSELLLQMSPALDAEAVRELRRLLGSTDLVKFARHEPGQGEGEALWTAAREWVLAYPPTPAPEPVPVPAEAA